MSISLEVPQSIELVDRNSLSNDGPLSPVELGGDDPDLLGKEYIFEQRFKIRAEDRRSFEKALKDYIPFMLDDFGMYFYRATTSVCFEETGNLEYSINFYLFTALRFVSPSDTEDLGNKIPRNEADSRDFLKTKFVMTIQEYSSRIYFQQIEQTRKPVFHKNQMPKDDYFGSDWGLHWSLFSMFVHYWLIVPDVQTDFFGILYQIYAFDLAHQGWFSKYVHYFTIPANVCFTTCFLCQFKIADAFGEPFELTGGFVFASFLALSYVFNGFMKKSVFWGLSTAFSVYILWLVACLWYQVFKTEGAPWYNPTTIPTNPLIWVYVASLVESLSHVIVPQLPPYIVGVNHWYGTIEFLLDIGNLWWILSIFGSITLSPLVSYISWPHLIGDMSIYQLLSLGYHKQFYKEYSRIARKAELTGNPAMDKLPNRFKDLIHGMKGNSGSPHSKDPFAMIFRKPYEAIRWLFCGTRRRS